MRRNEILTARGKKNSVRNRTFSRSAPAAGGERISHPLPNIVWLIGDDISRYDAGCMGSPVSTPNIDRLASEGVRFPNAFAVSPSCSPSRVSMFTGKYQHAAGAEDLHVPLPDHEPILPSLLKRKGYISASCGKLHLGSAGERQFDRIYAGSGDWIVFAEERPRGKPFFLSIGFTEAHRPFRSGIIPVPHEPEKVFVPRFLADCPEVRGELALYYDAISRMDLEIGKILEWIDDEKLADNTLLFYFSDQGMPFPRAKTTLYDSGLGVPFVARWKNRVPPGATSSGLLSLIDLTPTIAGPQPEPRR